MTVTDVQAMTISEGGDMPSEDIWQPAMGGTFWMSKFNIG